MNLQTDFQQPFQSQYPINQDQLLNTSNLINVNPSINSFHNNVSYLDPLVNQLTSELTPNSPTSINQSSFLFIDNIQVEKIAENQSVDVSLNNGSINILMKKTREQKYKRSTNNSHKKFISVARRWMLKNYQPHNNNSFKIAFQQKFTSFKSTRTYFFIILAFIKCAMSREKHEQFLKHFSKQIRSKVQYYEKQIKTTQNINLKRFRSDQITDLIFSIKATQQYFIQNNIQGSIQCIYKKDKATIIKKFHYLEALQTVKNVQNYFKSDNSINKMIQQFGKCKNKNKNIVQKIQQQEQSSSISKLEKNQLNQKSQQRLKLDQIKQIKQIKQIAPEMNKIITNSQICGLSSVNSHNIFQDIKKNQNLIENQNQIKSKVNKQQKFILDQVMKKTTEDSDLDDDDMDIEKYTNKDTNCIKKSTNLILISSHSSSIQNNIPSSFSIFSSNKSLNNNNKIGFRPFIKN